MVGVRRLVEQFVVPAIGLGGVLLCARCSDCCPEVYRLDAALRVRVRAGGAVSVGSDGYAIGATGLFVTVEDMLKLGIMLLQHGAHQGHQIVSPEWIAEVTKKRVSTDRIGRDGYGLGFWVRSDTDAFMANGMLGQLIYVSPKNNRVVAWQSCDNGSSIGPLTDFLVDSDI